MTRWPLIACAALLSAAGCNDPSNPQHPSDRQEVGGRDENAKLETVAEIQGAMPTGITVSRAGRIFINYPKWGDDVKFTVAELKDGRPVAYPDQQVNTPNWDRPETTFIAVQSVVVDPADRLWVLDTGSIQFGPASRGAAKLVGVDLTTNKVFKTITFPETVCLPTTYLNDVRFDLRRGEGGMAFITDSSMNGPNGIIVVDLAAGRSWRKLNDHASTKAESGFVPTVEGKPLMQRKPGQQEKPVQMGSDGIAISADGQRLYYCPLVGRTLYSVSVDALADENLPDAEVARTVRRETVKPGASDGLESDANGRVYATDYEHNAVLVAEPGKWDWRTLARGDRLLWPDTLSVAADGYVYFTANQLHRQKDYNWGQDLRRQPYLVFRVKAGAQPVALRK